MPMGSSICMVSVQVHAMRLERAIITPGSYSRPAMPLYSSHQPCGTEGCRKASRPSRVDFQSAVFTGKRAAPKTERQRYFEARTCRVSSTSAGVFRRSMQSVNSVRTGVMGRALNGAGDAMERSRARVTRAANLAHRRARGYPVKSGPALSFDSRSGKIAKALRTCPCSRLGGARTSPPGQKHSRGSDRSIRGSTTTQPTVVHRLSLR